MAKEIATLSSFQDLVINDAMQKTIYTGRVRDDLKLPDDSGEVPKSERKGWQFNS